MPKERARIGDCQRSRRKPTVFIIDSDDAVRDATRMLLEGEGIVARTFASAMAFLREESPERNSCIVVAGDIAGDLLEALHQRDIVIPAIVTTSGEVTDYLYSAVARVGGALLEKPYLPRELIAHVRRELDRSGGGLDFLPPPA